MIERSFVHVGGQPGAGKTTLIEHLLRGFDGFVSVARCHRDDSLGDFQETRPGGNPELRRYRDAGADDAILYRFPAEHARDSDPRKPAEAMVADLKRLRKDEEVFQDILAPLGNRIPITVVAGNLTDPRDPGTRKGLARILRSMRGR